MHIFSIIIALLGTSIIPLSTALDFNCTSLPNGNYPSTETCLSFFKCSNELSYTYDCPIPLHFNPIKLICDWPEDAGCTVGLTTTEPPTTTTRSPIDVNFCTGKPSGYYPDAEHCDGFIKCTLGQPYPYTCPIGLHFNPEIKVCDTPENAGCEAQITTSVPETTTEIITTTSTTTTSPDPDTTTTSPTTTNEPTTTEDIPIEFNCTGLETGYYPNPLACDSFFVCANDVTYKLPCPADQHFNPVELVCQPEEEAGCNIETTTETQPPPTTTEQSGEFTCDGRPDGLYPNPLECETFYICSGGNGNLLECPVGQHFNPIRKVCEPMEVAGCLPPSTDPTEEPEPSSSTTVQPSSTTTGEPGEFTCDGLPDGLYPNPLECETFYICNGGTENLLECPVGQHFNPIRKVCEPMEVAGCLPPSTDPTDEPSTTTTVQPSSTTTGEPGEFTCVGQPDGLYPNPLECETFYICSGGNGNLLECPVGQHFNPIRKVCEPMEVAGCLPPSTDPTDEPSTTTTVQPSSTTTGEPGEFTCVGQPDGLYPNPLECETFYICNGGNGNLLECPVGQHFNPIRKVCEPMEVAGCLPPSTGPTQEPITTTTVQPSSTTTGEPGEFTCVGQPDGLYPNPLECETFYICNGGNGNLLECPVGQHFNPIRKVCEPMEVAGCLPPSTDPTNEPSTTTTVQPSSTTTGEPGEFTCVGQPDGLYPNPLECETFYICNGGNGNLLECPVGQHFNPIRKVCQPMEEAGCIPSTDPSTTPETPIFDCVDKECGDYPDPLSCGTFYKCSNGTGTQIRCPTGLHFNPILLLCDFPENANCLINFCENLNCGLYSDPSSCTSFIECSENGSMTHHECPASLMFNPSMESCDLPDRVDCEV